MTKAYDVIVVGVGATGAATVHALAGRGVRVLGIEQFDVPHTLGSYHGDARAIRECGPMKRIRIIITYFGVWPEWIDLFLESCRFNPTIDWLIFTDCGLPRNRPGNVCFEERAPWEGREKIVHLDYRAAPHGWEINEGGFFARSEDGPAGRDTVSVAGATRPWR